MTRLIPAPWLCLLVSPLQHDRSMFLASASHVHHTSTRDAVGLCPHQAMCNMLLKDHIYVLQSNISQKSQSYLCLYKPGSCLLKNLHLCLQPANSLSGKKCIYQETKLGSHFLGGLEALFYLKTKEFLYLKWIHAPDVGNIL